METTSRRGITMVAVAAGLVVGALLLVYRGPWRRQRHGLEGSPENAQEAEQRRTRGPAPSPRGKEWPGANVDPASPAAVLPPRRVLRDTSEMVATLREESLAETVANLAWRGMYSLTRGSRVPAMALSFGASCSVTVDMWTLDGMLRNRRLLKVLGEVSRLPKRDAGGLVARWLVESLEAHDAKYVSFVGKFLKADRELYARKGKHLTLAWGTAGTPDGRPDVRGLRDRVLSLVLVAGSLELAGARAAVEAVVRKARSQEHLLRTEAADLPSHTRGQLLMGASCYNRVVLASGLCGTHGDRQEARAIREKLGIEERSCVLVAHDAVATPSRTARVPDAAPDFSGGPQVVRCVVVTDVEHFASLLRDLGYRD